MKQLFKKHFAYYKELGDKTMAQLTEEEVFWQPHPESNSVAVIVQHLAGNMLSRWTNFLTEDGEKPWRNRDQEFVNSFKTKKEVEDFWEKGWNCLFDALDKINNENLHQTIYIRGEAHSVLDAVLRQLAHYPYHIGQMVYAPKILKNGKWETLSIPRNQSEQFNIEMLKKQTESDIPQNSSPVCYLNSDEIREDFRTET